MNVRIIKSNRFKTVWNFKYFSLHFTLETLYESQKCLPETKNRTAAVDCEILAVFILLT